VVELLSLRAALKFVQETGDLRAKLVGGRDYSRLQPKYQVKNRACEGDQVFPARFHFLYDRGVNAEAIVVETVEFG